MRFLFDYFTPSLLVVRILFTIATISTLNGSIILAASANPLPPDPREPFAVKELAAIPFKGTSVDPLVFRPGKDILAWGRDDGRLSYWNSTDGKVKAVAKFENRIQSLQFSPDGKLLAIGDAKGGVHFCNADTAETLSTVKAHRTGVHRTVFDSMKQRKAREARDCATISFDLIQRWTLFTGNEAISCIPQKGASFASGLKPFHNVSLGSPQGLGKTGTIA